jgi:hypothetical protein
MKVGAEPDKCRRENDPTVLERGWTVTIGGYVELIFNRGGPERTAALSFACGSESPARACRSRDVDIPPDTTTRRASKSCAG